jgi:hypothetical protein
MFKFLRYKTGMFMCAGPAIIGFIIGLVIGAVVIILMAKGILPGFKICPTLIPGK